MCSWQFQNMSVEFETRNEQTLCHRRQKTRRFRLSKKRRMDLEVGWRRQFLAQVNRSGDEESQKTAQVNSKPVPGPFVHA
jgi:hypothetical protein